MSLPMSGDAYWIGKSKAPNHVDTVSDNHRAQATMVQLIGTQA